MHDAIRASAIVVQGIFDISDDFCGGEKFVSRQGIFVSLADWVFDVFEKGATIEFVPGDDVIVLLADK